MQPSAYHIPVELTKCVEVGTGGKIELTFPELQPGQKVDVHVLFESASEKIRPVFGRLKGLIKIHDDFDDPLPGFEEYT